MAREIIQSFSAGLPWSMRESVESYVDAVAAAIPDIEKDTAVKIPPDRIDEFLLIVAVRKIWSSVNAQYWTMSDSIDIAARSASPKDISGGESIRGFKIGRDEISQDSGPFVESSELRRDMSRMLKDLGIESLVTGSVSMSDLVHRLFGLQQ